MMKMQCGNLNRILKICMYRYSTATSPLVCERLVNRSLLRVSGTDACSLLQGLITNDMNHLTEAGSMFAMFLNSKGRVLYDTIIYKMPEINTYILETDKKVADLVIKHLNTYRLRRQIDITQIDDQYSVWARFDPDKLDDNVEPPPKTKFEIKEIDTNQLFIFKDPRLSLLGSRILAPVEYNLFNLFKSATSATYKWFRYMLGVGEGIEELPPGNCFPLEVNCDYLHGVSFHKGCYIGQELTARVYHTGIVRKRLMPLVLSSEFEKPPEKDEVIKAGESSVGKLKGYERNSGLALLRINQALDANELLINNISASTLQPKWWPYEAPRKMSPTTTN